MKDCAIPCPGCPNVQLGISASGESDVPNVAMQPDGSLMSAQITEQGFSLGVVSRDDIAENYPKIAEVIKKCDRPLPETATVARRGPLGWLGLKRTVVRQECQAVAKEELIAIAIRNGR